MRLNENNLNSPENTNKNYLDRDLDKPRIIEYNKRRQMIEGLKDGMKIVELGCGISNFLYLVKEEFPDCEVHGLDFADQVIERFKSDYPMINYQVGDALHTPYEDNYFDYVTAGELIEHIPNPQDLVTEMVRICKIGGVVSVTTPFLEKTWRPTDIPKEHLWEYDRDDMLNLFSKYGETKIKFFIDKPPGVGGIHMVTNCKICQK